MKLFGNTSKKKKSGKNTEKEVHYEEKSGKRSNLPDAEEKIEGTDGFLGALARKRIEKAKKALDTEEHRRRTPEERRRIEADVVKYQKRKVRNRLIVICVLLVFVIALIVFYKVTVRPPDINKPVKTTDPGTVQAPDGSRNPEDRDPNATPNVVSSTRNEGLYTFLVIGNDQGNGNTDTMFVGRLDTVNHKLNIVSIPRDTLVNVSWSVKKVNTILAFKKAGMPGLVEGLSDILGFEVDSYVSVDLKAFEALVDAIGGVYFDVPQNMVYNDPTQNLHINVSKGYQLLDGHNAVGVVRYRSGYAAGDIKRISVQQDFMKALAKQCLTFSAIASNITEYAQIFKDYVETDLTVGNIVWYGQEMLKMDVDDITFQTVPEFYNDSVRGLSYCSIYVDEWLDMINECLNPYKDPVTIDNVNILTRDANGNLYATTGTIAGGLDSFYNAGGSSHSSSSSSTSTSTPTPTATPASTAAPEPTPEATDEPAPDVTPEPTDSGESGETGGEAAPEPTQEATPEPTDGGESGETQPEPTTDAGSTDTGTETAVEPAEPAEETVSGAA